MAGNQTTLGPIRDNKGVDPNDPAFAPDQEQMADPGDKGLLDQILSIFTAETAEERLDRFSREAETEKLNRGRRERMMDRLKARRQSRQAEEVQAHSGEPNAFSLDRAVQDILRNKDRALTEPGT